MADYRLSASADDTLDEILLWTQENFGQPVREQYAALLVTAMNDIAESPMGPSISWKTTKIGQLGIYHISHSKTHVPNPPGQIGNPRHLVVFHSAADGVIEILGFIHDRMLMSRALKALMQQTP